MKEKILLIWKHLKQGNPEKNVETDIMDLSVRQTLLESQ